MWSQTMLQDGSSSNMIALSQFHDQAMLMVVVIAAYTLTVGSFITSNKVYIKLSGDFHTAEAVWTIVPAILLVALALPSLRLLYILDEVLNPSLSVKVMGHQWYWSYDYADLPVNFDSYMVPMEELTPGSPRLLEVDNRVVIPMGMESRFLITAADVIHSWAVPSLGVKVDAIPGRLNQVSVFPLRSGLFYGQCSEICGANHAFMPITVESIHSSDWVKWLHQQL